MTTAQSFPKWTSADVQMRSSSIVEFKVVVAGENGQDAKWEGGNNKKLQLQLDEPKMVIIRCEYGKPDLRVETTRLSRPPPRAASPADTPKLKPVVESKPGPQPTRPQDPPAQAQTPKAVESKPSFMKQNTSRHLMLNEDGSTNIQMSRTPSLMMLDAEELFKEAAAEEQHVADLARADLNMKQRRVSSHTLLQEMQEITDYADPSRTVMLQAFNWESHQAGKGDWYSIVASKIPMLKDMGITDLWLPPCSQSVAPQGYLPSQLFNVDGSKYGNKASLQSLLSKLHKANMRGVADIVINHRCGDKQDSDGRWNVFTSTGMEHRPSFAGVVDWQGWAITLGDKFSDGTGERGPGKYDGKFDAAPDIDHGNKKVQQSIQIWLRWLRLELGFDAWRFDFVKGYSAEFVGLYCKKSEPAWAVGELWLDMAYDDNGLAYNQDRHRQDTINWINATGKASTAFDFTTKGVLQEAVRNCQYWRLKDSKGKPPGVIGWMPSHAVTFLDNHDTGSTQAHWPFPNDKIMIGYAYILTHPGIPCVFWDHVCDWGDNVRNDIQKILRLRIESGMKVDFPAKILQADHDLYIAEIGAPAVLRVALGPRVAPAYDRNYWQKGASGHGWCVWISKAAKAKYEEARSGEPQTQSAQPASTGTSPERSPVKKASAAPQAFEPAPRSVEHVEPELPQQPVIERVPSMDICLKLRLPKHLEKANTWVVVCGEVPSLGSWTPASGTPMQKHEDLWVLGEMPHGVGAGTLFKFVIMEKGQQPKWEGRANRNWREAEAPVLTHIWDSSQSERPKKPPGQGKKLNTTTATGKTAGFIQRIAQENCDRSSYRLKLELPRILMEEEQLNSLMELACLQAYLTWISSGQISCKEDGGHHRPCAAANSAKAVTEALWDLASNGDAELFIARRIFPCLPSFSDEFTCAVPMTRIRDIAHRNDIPKDMKLYIKHELQNKLHRCADPGDLVKLDQLVERIDREGGYSEGFVREMHIFQVELRDFFNATGLDDSARKIAQEDGSVRGAVDHLLHLKFSNADPFHQLGALTELRKMVINRVAEQNWMRLDIELEKYAFVLLSQVAGQLENESRGSRSWWERLSRSLVSALAQTQLTGISQKECEIAIQETESVSPHISDGSKGPFLPQRLVATMDRTLRICFNLQAALEQAYSGVPDLGRALNIDSHAISVFVEAELRASVLFQVSKLAQLAMQQAKACAGLPLWTAISAGACVGRCLRLRALAETWNQTLPKEGTVVFCEEASGDEEIPNLVKGVVVARDLPVLSHLALRARQLGVVFACTAESALFQKVQGAAQPGRAVRLSVSASGDVHAEGVGDSELIVSEIKPTAVKKPKLGELNLVSDKVFEVVEIADQPQFAGSKAASSGKLEKLAMELGFKAPKGVAIPFGVMKKAVHGAVFESALQQLQSKLGSNSPDIEAAALAVRAAVEKLSVPGNVLKEIAVKLPKAERVAVRSSANSEDLEKVSGAGLHDSVLGVALKDQTKLQNVVLQVWSSMFTLRAVQSRHAAGMPLYEGIAMGVLVQPMVSLAGSVYAFIAFSKDAVARNDNAVYIELCIGLGETLASANEPGTPYRLIVQKQPPHEVEVASLGSFSFGLQDMPDGLKKVPIDYSQERLSTDRDYLVQMARDIGKVAVGIEKGYGVPMDMEGVVLERGGSREIHLVQARPIVGE